MKKLMLLSFLLAGCFGYHVDLGKPKNAYSNQLRCAEICGYEGYYMYTLYNGRYCKCGKP